MSGGLIESMHVLTFTYLISYLKQRAKGKTSQAIKKLLNLQANKTARVVRNGKKQEILVEEILEGDILIVHPGEYISIDGGIIRRQSAIDASMLMGESISINKK